MFHPVGMAASGPPNLFMGEMGARELPNIHLPGSRVEQTGSVTWQQDTAGNWTRLEGSGESNWLWIDEVDAVARK